MSFAENMVQDEEQQKQIFDCFVWDEQEALGKTMRLTFAAEQSPNLSRAIKLNDKIENIG